MEVSFNLAPSLTDFMKVQGSYGRSSERGPSGCCWFPASQILGSLCSLPKGMQVRYMKI
jgi:hypothetical protein